MINNQDWITEAITRRFDDLTGKAERLEDIAVLIERAAILEQHLKGILDKTNQNYFKDLLDLSTQQCAMQKEWLYIKGVQDGMRMLNYMVITR